MTQDNYDVAVKTLAAKEELEEYLEALDKIPVLKDDSIKLALSYDADGYFEFKSKCTNIGSFISGHRVLIENDIKALDRQFYDIGNSSMSTERFYAAQECREQIERLRRDIKGIEDKKYNYGKIVLSTNGGDIELDYKVLSPETLPELLSEYVIQASYKIQELETKFKMI